MRHRWRRRRRRRRGVNDQLQISPPLFVVKLRERGFRSRSCMKDDLAPTSHNYTFSIHILLSNFNGIYRPRFGGKRQVLGQRGRGGLLLLLLLLRRHVQDLGKCFKSREIEVRYWMVMNCEGAGKLCGSLPWQVHFRLGAKDRGKKIFNKLKNMAGRSKKVRVQTRSSAIHQNFPSVGSWRLQLEGCSLSISH